MYMFIIALCIHIHINAYRSRSCSRRPTAVVVAAGTYPMSEHFRAFISTTKKDYLSKVKQICFECFANFSLRWEFHIFLKLRTINFSKLSTILRECKLIWSIFLRSKSGVYWKKVKASPISLSHLFANFRIPSPKTSPRFHRCARCTTLRTP